MKFPPYETYVQSKLSWLDEIPNGWDVIPIKFGLEIPITDGPHETPEIFNEGIPFLSAESVKKDKLDFSRKRGFISIEEHKRFSKKYKPKRGDVYMVKSGATTGNMARVETDREFNIWSPLAAMRPDTEMLTTDFLFFFMKSKPFFHSVELNWNYGTQQNIGMGVIANLQMALPPVAIQKKIASFLEHKTQQINRLIKKKKELIEKLEEQRTAIITQAATKGIDENAKLKPSGVDWLSDVPEHWDVRRLKFMASIQNGRDYKDVEVEEGGYPVYGSGGEFRRSSQYLYEGESVLFGRKGTIDKPLYVNCRFWTVDTMFYSEILANTVAKFLYYSALTFQYQKLATQTALPSITQHDLENYTLTYPCKEEQILIVNYLDEQSRKIKEMITVSKEAIEKLEEYRSAIITSAVTGKIDVREVVIPKEVE